MGIHLSTRKIAQLQSASAVLLSPFSYETGDEWRVAVCAAVAPAIDARAAMFGLSLPGERLLIGDPDAVAPMQPYMPPTGWLRDGYLRSRRKQRLGVIDWRDAYDPESLRRTDFYSEVVRPNQLFAPLMLTADVPGAPLGAAVFSYFDNESRANEGAEQRKEVLQLLVPAFRAGVTAYAVTQRQRETLIAFGELSHVALALFSLPGRTLHETNTFRQLVSRDPEGMSLRAEARRLARNLSDNLARQDPVDHGDHPIRSRVATRAGSYGLSAMAFEG